MKWELSIEDGNYLLVKTSGHIDLQSFLSMLRDSIAECEKQNCNRIFIDNRKIDGVINIFDIYSIPELFDKINWAHRLHVVLLSTPQHEQDFRFLELVCRNRGYSVATFKKMEDALMSINK